MEEARRREESKRRLKEVAEEARKRENELQQVVLKGREKKLNN